MSLLRCEMKSLSPRETLLELGRHVTTGVNVTDSFVSLVNSHDLAIIFGSNLMIIEKTFGIKTCRFVQSNSIENGRRIKCLKPKF